MRDCNYLAGGCPTPRDAAPGGIAGRLAGSRSGPWGRCRPGGRGGHGV